MKCYTHSLWFCVVLLIGLVGTWEPASAQTRTFYTTTPSTINVYNFDLAPRSVTSRSCLGSPASPFTPSGVTTPMNGYSRPTRVNELDAMNLSFIVKAQSLPPELYKAFSAVANEMPPKRSAMLRRLIYELPSKMEGTTYVPPSPSSIMQAMRKVVYSTDAQVDAYWRNR